MQRARLHNQALYFRSRTFMKTLSRPACTPRLINLKNPTSADTFKQTNVSAAQFSALSFYLRTRHPRTGCSIIPHVARWLEAVYGARAWTNRLVLGLGVAMCWSLAIPHPACAQGQDNISGVTGGFNGWVTSAGMYDPYTANARRVVTDITVPGALGTGLTWTRILNTRYYPGAGLFGFSGWGHNWQWYLTVVPNSPTAIWNLTYPTGESYTLNAPLGSTAVTIPGSGDQLRADGSDWYLWRQDGSKVYFKNTKFAQGTYYFQAQQVIDPYGQITTIAYNSGNQVTQITEPGGRWLKVFYLSLDQISRVDSIDGQWVQYNYETFGQYSVAVLSSASYSDGTSANYTYQTSNAQSYNGVHYGDSAPLPLLLSDCRANSRMQQIQYRFVSGAAPGFLSAELNASGQAVSTLQVPNSNTRTELRGDGQTRTFTYSNALLSSRGQFNGYSSYLWYDSNDFINKIQDPDTHQTQIQRTQFGTITKIIHPDGTARIVNYTDLNNPYWVASIEDELGNTTSFTRDGSHHITAINYPDNTVDHYWYNSLGEITTHEQRNSGFEGFTYNTVGQLTSYEDAVGEAYNYSYNTAWLLSGVQEVARNLWSQFAYNNLGQITTLTNPDNTTEIFGYNSDGWLTSFTDENSHTWQTAYDAYGRVSTTTDPLGRTTQYFYARPGQTELQHTANAPGQIILPSGRASEMLYDGDWRMTSTTVGNGSNTTTVQAAYDGLGNQIRSVDGAGNTTVYAYDSRNRVTSVTDPNSNQTQYGYDALNHVTARIEPDANQWSWQYDEMERVVTAVDPYGVAATYTYDQIDDVLSYTPPGDSTYSWTYDAIGRQRTESNPDGSGEDWLYDSAGNLAMFISTNNYQKYFTFDVRNRLTNTQWGGKLQPNITYSYDPAGNVLGISSQGSTITYTYDAGNEVAVETQAPTGGPTQTINYTYTPDGLPKQLSIPNTYAEAWTYEPRDLISSISDLSGDTFASYTYDPAARLASCSLGNGASVSYTYDPGSRLVKQVDALTQGASWPADIGYNVVNEITGITHEGLGDDRTFGYSPRRDLHSVTFGGPTPSPETLATNFDPNGNWLNLKINGTLQTQYTVNSLDQYTVLTTYDANGNPTTANLSYDGQENLAGLNGGSFQFNHENELISGTSGTNTVQIVYDGLGRCVSRSVNGVTTYITYSGWSPILETDSSGNILDARVYGLGIDDLITELTPSLSPKFFYHKDASGNVQFVSDPNGDLIERYSYSPFGAFDIYDPNWNALSGSTVGNRFYFQGREYLAGLGIYDFRNRAYSPAIGRFLQMDPIRFAGGSNLYRFAGNDPVNGGDPLGLDLDQMTVTGYPPAQDSPSDFAPFAFGSAGSIGLSFIPPHAMRRAPGGVTDSNGNIIKIVITLSPNGSSDGTDIGFVPGQGSGGNGQGGGGGNSGGLPAWVNAPSDPNSPAGQAIRGISPYIGNAGPDIYNATMFGAGMVGPLGAALKAGSTIRWLIDLLGGSRQCFPSGTKIATPNGLTDIEQIKAGDSVFAYDFQTGKVVEDRVEKTHKNFTYHWVNVDIDGETIQSTRSHPFWVESQQQWVKAVDLKSGMKVRLRSGRQGTVRATKPLDLTSAETTYNFEVAGEHDYFVGSKSVLVHNGPGFIVTYPGTVIPVPQGAQGPGPVENQRGFSYTGGSGGRGLNRRVTGVRIMDSTDRYPNGYVSYMNKNGQTVDPKTGRTTVGKSDPMAHLSCD